LEQKFEAVQKILESLHLADIPRLVVLNKADLLPPHEAQGLAARYKGIAVSAVKRTGLTDLVHAAEERLGREKPLMKEYGEGARGAVVA
ncbi:MAG TPA: hypothetical protein VLQ45_15290, partial [Thermoanaerobaculia bacterium]|nr:hypothetical protein [Thermoanaerobaculia bacterium]